MVLLFITPSDLTQVNFLSCQLGTMEKMEKKNL